MNGDIFMLKKDGQVVAAVKSNDVETACDVLEVAGQQQGQWREHMAGQKSWRMSAQWLILSTVTMAVLLQPGQTFSMEMYNRDSLRNTIYGEARLEVCQVKATQGTLVEGIFQFKGTAWLRPTYNAGDFNSDFNSDFLIA